MNFDNEIGQQWHTKLTMINIWMKQAGAKLGQDQLKLGFGFSSVYLYQIDKLGI